MLFGNAYNKTKVSLGQAVFGVTVTVTDFYTEEYIRDNYRILGMHDYSLFGKAKDENGVEYDDSLDHYLSAEKL